MDLLVAQEITGLSESFLAGCAVIAPLSGVDLLVSVQVSELLESLATDGTTERTVARMHQVMAMQARNPGEVLGAETAL